MPVKFVGSAVMIVSALYYSYLLIKNANRKISQLEGLCTLILYIKNNIDSFMRPVGDIINSFDGYDEAMEAFMESARTHGLAAAAENNTLSVGADAYHILRDFSGKIGCGYKEDEIRLCTYCHNAMQDILNRDREDIRKKMKMYKTLPVMSAMSVVLILL